MNTPDKELLTKIVTLIGDPRFDSILSWLEDSEESTVQQLVMSTPENSEVLKGRARELKDLNTVFRTAAEQIENIKEREKFHPEHLT